MTNCPMCKTALPMALHGLVQCSHCQVTLRATYDSVPTAWARIPPGGWLDVPTDARKCSAADYATFTAATAKALSQLEGDVAERAYRAYRNAFVRMWNGGG